MNKVLSILVVAVVLIVLMSCGSDNPVLPELPLEELSFQEDRIPLAGEEYIYRQSISIDSENQEGGLFAFRLSTLTGAQPQGCSADDEGWLYHRTAGADPSLPPTQAEYDHYSSTYVGIKHSQNGANAVLLGFPLSCMEQADAAQALQQLLASILGERK